MKTNKTVAISIIIPVFNVYDYIDECMESIVNQTFSDFEVLLINDGSTDGTDIKCQEWTERDARIRYVSKDNEGLSPTRNLGIRLAQGEYLSFIDPDDWVDLRFLELLYNKGKETDADIVECDLYRYNNNTGKQTYKISSGSIGLMDSLAEHIVYGNTTPCKCLIRKRLFDEYSIEFPECHSPARGIYALLLALSNRIENVDSALYYYRIFRKGSLTEVPRENIEETEIGIQAFEYLLKEFKRCGIYQQYENIVERSIKYKLSDLLAVFFQRYEADVYRRMKESYEEYVRERFPHSHHERYLTLGGYNLNRIVWDMNLLHDPSCRFNFSSLISIVRPVKQETAINHKNRYRQLMIRRDVESEYWNVLKEQHPEYVFIDLIEERFDVLQAGEGYVTKSDAWEEADANLKADRVIKRESMECQRLWEECCNEFVERMQREFPNTKLVLIKNYLSEKHGNAKKQENYENIDQIRETNRLLQRYYEYFETRYEDVKTIEVKELDHYFTDEKFIYGVVPSHLNDAVNREIAGKIENVIGL